MKVDTSRFSGFASLYSESRPVPPQDVCRILLGYLGKDRSSLTVDLGCGTGLSTSIWSEFADEVVGIDPTDDMLAEARKRFPGVSFLKGDSGHTGMEASRADLVTCSQSFHWMEPQGTIQEVARILRSGGVFAAYDCQWPVSWDWESEKAYEELMGDVDGLVSSLPDLNRSDVYFPKERHLENLQASGKFRYCTEVFFHHQEPCSPPRFAGIALSQGQIQKLVKSRNTEITPSIDRFLSIVNRSTATQMFVSYRMVIGVK